jgi:hypothetical protein
MALTSKVRVGVSAQQTAPHALGGASDSVSKDWSVSFADGAAAGQANVVWQATRTIAASGTDDLDLAGSLTNALGSTVFAKVKSLTVVAATGNTNNVVVGGAPSNTWIGPFGDATDKLVVRPGGAQQIGVGEGDLNAYAVTAATGDILRVANSGAGTSVTYDIIVIGTAS